MQQFENLAFQQSSFSGVGFNLITQNNSFSSVFDPKPLEEASAERIEKLLIDNMLPESISQNQIENNFSELKRLTAEVIAIGKQSIILTGERVYRASELLKPYKDGTFTKWLEEVFGSRKTGYNMLSYYNFYNELPDDDLKQKFKKMPQKTAYILASRKDAEFNTKAEIVREHHDLSHDELVLLIQDKIPLEKHDKRAKKISNEKLISIIKDTIQKLRLRKDELTDEDRIALGELVQDLSFLSDRPDQG